MDPLTTNNSNSTQKPISLCPIRDLYAHCNEKVWIRGWVHEKSRKGKIAFLRVRDGTGSAQIVGELAIIGEEIFQTIDHIRHESVIEAFGTLTPHPKKQGVAELQLEALNVVSMAEEPYPIPRKPSGPEFLHDHRHLWLRTARQQAILKIRSTLSYTIHTFFRENDFIQTDSPILTGAIGEEAGTLFSTPYFRLGNAYLAQTGQLYLEATIGSLERAYCFGPTFRAEKSLTRRHLTEFWMAEAEQAFVGHEENLEHQERLISRLIHDTLKHNADSLAQLGRDPEPLMKIKPPFPRLPYPEAISLLKDHGSTITFGDDLGAQDETTISQCYDQPVFITHFPKKIKAFYMKCDPENPLLTLSADLLAPEGRGEIIGGGQREENLDTIIAQIKDQNLSLDAYKWYLDLRRYGTVKHAGFGLGLERVVAWVCGLDHIREAIPFPRLINRITP